MLESAGLAIRTDSDKAEAEKRYIRWTLPLRVNKLQFSICGFALSVLCATHSCLEFSAKPFVEGIVAQQQLAC